MSYAAIGIAAGALLVSAVVGFSASRTANRALELAERQEARREGNLDLYLNEAVSWRVSDETRILGVHVQMANATDRPNSIVRAELHLTYEVEAVLTALKVGHMIGVTEPDGDIVPAVLPLSLQPNEAANGWFLFGAGSTLTGEHEIRRYDFVVTDIHGIDESIQVSIFREAQRAEAD